MCAWTCIITVGLRGGFLPKIYSGHRPGVCVWCVCVCVSVCVCVCVCVCVGGVCAGVESIYLCVCVCGVCVCVFVSVHSLCVCGRAWVVWGGEREREEKRERERKRESLCICNEIKYCRCVPSLCFSSNT